MLVVRITGDEGRHVFSGFKIRDRQLRNPGGPAMRASGLALAW